MIITDSEEFQQGLLQRLTVEVRHALHGILGSFELISEGSLSPAQLEELSCGRESARELLRIVADISELGSSNAHREKPSRFGFPDMLDDLTNLLGDRVARKGLKLHWIVDPPVPRTIRGHRQTIERILYRLLDNSIKFTERGGITIRVRARHLDHRACQIAIEVSDTGCGIARDLPLNEIRLDESTGVLGFGLQVARKQLAEIGGELDVFSNEQEGATAAAIFWVTVVSDPVISPVGHEPSLFIGPLHLLVAEDSDDSFFVFQHFIADEGHTVTRALNGAQAVDMFKSGEYDLVVMDVNMPVMDGYTASRAIREWETQQQTARRPILLLSADDAARQSRLGSMAGCSGYLAKPVSKEELLWALRKYSEEPR